MLRSTHNINKMNQKFKVKLVIYNLRYYEVELLKDYISHLKDSRERDLNHVRDMDLNRDLGLGVGVDLGFSPFLYDCS